LHGVLGEVCGADLVEAAIEIMSGRWVLVLVVIGVGASHRVPVEVVADWCGG
jgi:hypothetical protein